jgi:hypothetical protein
MSDFLPQIPSDNLYKFIAFSGLFLVVFFIVYPDIIEQEYLIEIARQEYETRRRADSLEISNKNGKAHLELIKTYFKKAPSADSITRKLKMNSLVRNSGKAGYRAEQEFLQKAYPELADNYGYVLEKEILDSLRSISFSNFDPNKSFSKYRENLVLIKKKRLEYINGMKEIGVFTGLILFISGILLWYTKIQKSVDKKLRKDAQ